MGCIAGGASCFDVTQRHTEPCTVAPTRMMGDETSYANAIRRRWNAEVYCQISPCLCRSTARPTPVQPPTSPGRSSDSAFPPRQANKDDDNDEYDDFEDYTQRPSSKSGLSVEQRRQQASKDIAAAKARQAAFESQGRSQFTDTDAVQPETPEFSEESTAPATATTILDDSKTSSSHRSFPEHSDSSSSSKQPDSSSATETFVLGESRPGSSASSSRQRQQTAAEPDSFKPVYAQVQLLYCCMAAM